MQRRMHNIQIFVNAENIYSNLTMETEEYFVESLQSWQ